MLVSTCAAYRFRYLEAPPLIATTVHLGSICGLERRPSQLLSPPPDRAWKEKVKHSRWCCKVPTLHVGTYACYNIVTAHGVVFKMQLISDRVNMLTKWLLLPCHLFIFSRCAVNFYCIRRVIKTSRSFATTTFQCQRNSRRSKDDQIYLSIQQPPFYSGCEIRKTSLSNLKNFLNSC